MPSPTLTRRDCLLATLALAVSARVHPAAPATPSANAGLRAALDAKASVANRLASLARFDPAALSPSAAIDLETVRAGLAIDLRMAALGGARTGTAYYTLLLERCLGEAIAPVEAHRLLEGEVTRLSRRADSLLRELGYRNGTLGARFLAAAGDARWLYSDDAAGRDRAVADMNWRLHTDNGAPVPAVRRRARLVPERAGGAPVRAGRSRRQARLPTIAHTTVRRHLRGDLRDIRRRPRWSLPSVVHHELLPGHLLQMPLEVAAGAHALRLEYTRAFMEGWATYAEELAADDGAFRDDAPAELGLLHWLLFRALRGLADTGIHHAGWSRAQALQTLRLTQGLAAYFAPFEADVDRIMAEPAIRAAEALVWLRLRSLGRAVAPRDPRAFHRLVLQHSTGGWRTSPRPRAASDRDVCQYLCIDIGRTRGQHRWNVRRTQERAAPDSCHARREGCLADGGAAGRPGSLVLCAGPRLPRRLLPTSRAAWHGAVTLSPRASHWQSSMHCCAALRPENWRMPCVKRRRAA